MCRDTRQMRQFDLCVEQQPWQNSHMTPMNPKTEKLRGYKEASQQFEHLRAKWPHAFPAKARLVRPIASGAIEVLAETLGWSKPYAKAVLQTWKMREPYCRAVLAYSERIDLNGMATTELVDDIARAAALERIAARQRRREKKDAHERLKQAAISKIDAGFDGVFTPIMGVS